RLGVTAQTSIRQGSVPEKLQIARVQLNGAFEVSDRLGPTALTTIDQSGYVVYLGIIREGAPGEIELGASAIVIEKAPIAIIGQSAVDFSSVGLEADSILDRHIAQLTTGGSVIVHLEHVEMHLAEHAISEQEIRIARDRFVE